MEIKKYSFGMGDRFGHQGHAQLAAVVEANRQGIPVFPAWNKSNREHQIIESDPMDLRREADDATQAASWADAYYVDADHINLTTVDRFIPGSNFFTLDVAAQVGTAPSQEELDAFLAAAKQYQGALSIPGIERPFELNTTLIQATARQYLAAIVEAGRIYKHIADRKGTDNFVTEVSIDETDTPQTPAELFLILVMLAQEGVPAQTIAPKFTGRFNKGVDYVGDLAKFEQEFDEDLHVLAYAVDALGLPGTLKLSVHSGSDKFSLYPIIRRMIQKHDCGLHVKTAGTTWLEEVIGLAEAGGDGLALAKEIYAGAFAHYEDLTAPYATVIDIDQSQLPAPEVVADWSAEAFTGALRHELEHPLYNPHFRQLMHVGFKIAAKLGTRYTKALDTYREIIGRNVTYNLLHRHILSIFPESAGI